MMSFRSAIVVAAALIVALWWGVQPPRYQAETGAPLATQKAGQCPPGSRLEGKQCVCASGSTWTGSACTRLGGA